VDLIKLFVEFWFFNIQKFESFVSFIRNCVAALIILNHWRLLLLILNDIWFGVSCFCLHALLHYIAAFVLYNFSFVSLYWYICFAYHSLADFMFIASCIVIQLCNINQ